MPLIQFLLVNFLRAEVGTRVVTKPAVKVRNRADTERTAVYWLKDIARNKSIFAQIYPPLSVQPGATHDWGNDLRDPSPSKNPMFKASAIYERPKGYLNVVPVLRLTEKKSIG
jgi:hypothetical protein